MEAKSRVAASGFALAMILAAGMVAGIARAAPEDSHARGFEWKDGAEVYAKVCGYCHDTQVGPPIRNRQLPLAYIRAVVRNGNRAMPAFRASEIDDESLTKLAEYISKN
ncbi:cytochrome c [Nitrosovibrio sp. Nv6]|uniref:c-type cytochrome n=1 Tax=Nitrosovibrio sp. Nv6 TaxID=1855340 RepID=UPI0008AC5F7E|nr:cytochrome c [Nitrosovibrio sp. Nv6]SEO53970.1 Cytochrome C oxidase, cbb3-type, subunit III [Nitrosovibrio sp. Nv6]